MPRLTRRVQAAVLVTAAVAGYAGAAVYTALAEPGPPPLEVATDFGPGDGLTRYVVTAEAGDVAPLLTELETLPGVASAQRLFDGSALVATRDLAPGALRAVSGVTDVVPSTSVSVRGTISDPYWAQYGWNLENTGGNAYQQSAVADADVDATTGWEAGTGEGIVVAVVDSGYDSDHPDLAGALWTNPDQPCGTVDTDGNGLAGDCHGWNFYANTADIDNGALGTHGASVSGVVGARAGNGYGSAGVAPGVTIMPLVVGGGSTMDVNLASQAIRYAVDNGASVINASWGGSFSGPPLDNLRAAIAYAAAHDVLVVAAAGNDSADRDTSVPDYPTNLPDANLVTVGSSTASDTLAAHSAYGATSVDLFAPGEKLAVAWNDGGMRLASGTSFAAPHVAAAYALYRAVMPTATHAQLKQALLDDADRVPAFQGRSVTGGRLTTAHLAAVQQGQVRYAFSATTAPAAGPVTPSVAVSGSTVAGSFTVTIGLGMAHEGSIWAVADEPITLAGATLTTDDAGEVTFTLGSRTTLDGLVLAPTLDLGEGRYVLTVQLHRDSDPLGRTTAAPVLVGQAALPPPAGPDGSDDGGAGGPAPGTPEPGTTTPGTPGPGTSAPGTPQPGTTTPGTPDPGTTTPGTPDPGTSAPGTPQPGTTTPGTANPDMPAPGTPEPGTTTPGTPDPGTSAPGTPQPGTPQPGTTTPGTANPDMPAPGTPEPGTTTPGTPEPGSPPGGGGVITYPASGIFQVTSISPTRVDVTGGTTVTVTGRALPEGARVRVGDTAAATVVSSSATQVVFRTPARVAGTYDVHLFAPDGTTQVLTGALEYVAVDGPAPDDGTGSPPPSGTAPDTGDDTGSDGGDDGPDAPAEVTGPNGERLVRTTRFAGLGASFWTMDCSSSCAGTVL